jgi:cyclopropane fatty-acyl-phospholipid synthase-like methyltransferase
MENNSPTPIMFDWYTRYYAVVASSQANAAYCQQLYGRNLCQHGFAEMAHLDHLIQVSKIRPGERLLDLGCGNGMISAYIAEQTGAHVTGIDFIPEAIHQALLRTEDRRQQLDFQVMDMTRLAFPPGSFDVILSVDTLYFADVYDTLRPMIPLFKPGGRLAAFFDQSCDPDQPLETYPKEITHVDGTEIAQAFQRLGLPYQAWDYSQEMLDHLQRRKPVLASLKDQFAAEGNLFLYDNHLGEADGIERAYLNGAGKRYLYLVELKD